MKKIMKGALTMLVFVAMFLAPLAGMVNVPSVKAAPPMEAPEAAPGMPTVEGVNADGDDFVVMNATVNAGGNPVVGQQNVPITVTLNSTKMDNFNEHDGDDVLWNVSFTVVPVFEYLDPETGNWTVTEDISFPVDMVNPEMWIEDEGPWNALWINEDETPTKFVPWYMMNDWNDSVYDFIDADNDGDILQDDTVDNEQWEVRNVSYGEKYYPGLEMNIAGDALPGEYRVTTEIFYRYNTHVNVSDDMDDDPATDQLGIIPNGDGDNMFQNEQPLGDWMYYYWVPWDTDTGTFPTDIRDVVSPLGEDGAPGWAAETDAHDGIDNNGNWLRFGFDGAPGIAGVDDDGNGIIDDLSEEGYGDDHNVFLYGDDQTDFDGPFADFNGDGDYTYDPQPFIDEGNPFNDAAWELGLDGEPGVAGVDDDGMNGIDDPGEIGWPGSDDIIQTPDDNGNWRANELPLVYGAYTIADDLDRGLLFPPDVHFETRDDGGVYENNEFMFLDNDGTPGLSGNDWVLFPLWDSALYPDTPTTLITNTPGTSVPDSVYFNDLETPNDQWDQGTESLWRDTNNNGVYDVGEAIIDEGEASFVAGLDPSVPADNQDRFVTIYPDAIYANSGGGAGFGSNDIIWLDTVNVDDDAYDNGEFVFLRTYHTLEAGATVQTLPANSAFYNGDDQNDGDFDWVFNTGDRIWINSVGNTMATSPDHSPTVELPQCFFDLMDKDDDGYMEVGDRNIDEIWEINWFDTDDGEYLANLDFQKIDYYYEPEDGDTWTEGAQFNDWESIADNGMGDPSLFTTTLLNNTWDLIAEGYDDTQFGHDDDGQNIWFNADPAMDPYNVSIRWALQEAWHNMWINSYNEDGDGEDNALWDTLPVVDQFPYDVWDGNGTWEFSGYEGDTVWADNNGSNWFSETEWFTFEVDTAGDPAIIENGTMYAGDQFKSVEVELTIDGTDSEDVYLQITPPTSDIELVTVDAYNPEMDDGVAANFYYRANVAPDTPPGIYECDYTLTYTNEDGIEVTATGTLDITIDFTPVVVVRDWEGISFEQGEIRETFTVTFENVGNVPLRGVNMTLDVANPDDNLYPTDHQWEEGEGEGEWTTFDLSVRLDAPGDPLEIGDTVQVSFDSGILEAIPSGTHVIPFKYTAYYEDDGATGNPSRFVEVMVYWAAGMADNGLLDGFNDLDLMKTVLEDPMGAAAPHPVGVPENYHTDLFSMENNSFGRPVGVRDIYVDTEVLMVEKMNTWTPSGPIFINDHADYNADIPVTLALWNLEEEMNLEFVGGGATEWGQFALTDIEMEILATEDSPFTDGAVGELHTDISATGEEVELYTNERVWFDFSVSLRDGVTDGDYPVPIMVSAHNELTGQDIVRYLWQDFDIVTPNIDVDYNAVASTPVIRNGPAHDLLVDVDVRNNQRWTWITEEVDEDDLDDYDTDMDFFFDFITFEDVVVSLGTGDGTPFIERVDENRDTSVIEIDELGGGVDVNANFLVDRSIEAEDGVYEVPITIVGVSNASGQMVYLEDMVEVRYFPSPPNLIIEEMITTDIRPGHPFELELTIRNYGSDTAQNIDIFLNGYTAQYDWAILSSFLNFTTPYEYGCCGEDTNYTVIFNGNGQQTDEGELIHTINNTHLVWDVPTFEELGLKDAYEIYDLYDYHNRSQSSPKPRVKHIHVNELAGNESVTITFLVEADNYTLPGKLYNEHYNIQYTDSFGNDWDTNEVLTIKTGSKVPPINGDDDDNGGTFNFDEPMTWACMGLFVIILIIVIIALAVTGRGGGHDDEFDEFIEDEDFEEPFEEESFEEESFEEESFGDEEEPPAPEEISEEEEL